MVNSASSPGEPEGPPVIDREYEDMRSRLKGRLRVYHTEHDFLVRLNAWPLRPEDRADWSYVEVRTCCLNKSKIRGWLAFGASIALWMFGEADEDWHDAVHRMTTDFISQVQKLPDEE